MFSGIVEAVEPIVFAQKLPGALRIQVKKPSYFNDLNIGDSISTNGVCLTLEAQTPESMTFALAAETLLILKMDPEMDPKALHGQRVNLERSLRLGDRIHGHLVSGHVEGLGQVLRTEGQGESWFLDVQIPASLLPMIWKKGSITLHGVSLTVNAVEGDRVSVCLIPETLKRTNLKDLRVGDFVNVEPDYFAKVLVHNFSDRMASLLAERAHGQQ